MIMTPPPHNTSSNSVWQNPKGDQKGPQLNPVLKNTFQLTYICLMTTATITFIEALRTPKPGVRHVMNLETAVSLIAGYFYSTFMERIHKVEEGIQPIFDWGELVKLRYIDWSLTTPLMLTVLTIVMAQNLRVAIPFFLWLLILGLNFVMLGFGYAGETGVLPSLAANLAGFTAFFAMFALLYNRFLRTKNVFANNLIFGLYLVVWSGYGFAYFFDDVWKNAAYNVLDVISKVFVGLGLWVYFTGIIGKKELP